MDVENTMERVDDRDNPQRQLQYVMKNAAERGE
jgi:hypothetical protein